MCLRACRGVRLVSLRGEPELDRDKPEGSARAGDSSADYDSPTPLSRRISRKDSINSGTALDRVLVQILIVSGKGGGGSGDR